MNYKHVLVAGLSALLLSVSGCGDNQKDIAGTSGLRTSLTISGSTSRTKVVSAMGESFFVKVSAPKQWSLSISPETAKEWLRVDVSSDVATQDKGVSVTLDANTSVQRDALLILRSATVADTLTIIQQPSAKQEGPGPTPPPPPSDPIPSPPPTHDQEDEPSTPPTPPAPSPSPTPKPTIPAGEHILGDPTRIEIPALAGGSNNYFVTHRTSDGVVNYSLEYDATRLHARWVAYTFDNETSAKAPGIKRTDAWKWDPVIPRTYSTEKMFSGSGYSRGHLVASSDRYYSRQANEQTFYYTNMSPQLQDHNGGIWSNLEQLLQNWGRNASFRDVIYVVKGGTIRDGEIETNRVRGKIVVPKYYYMAIVVKKGGNYQGLAFWTEHRKYSKTSYRSLAITIDELEEKTGIDFFPNLDDAIEQRIESEPVSANNWPGI